MHCRFIQFATLCLLFGGAVPAHAASSPHLTERVVQFVDRPEISIKLDNSGCWRYTGTAMDFDIQVDAGDRLMITAAGEAQFGNGRVTWANIGPRDVEVWLGSSIHAVKPVGAGSVYVFPKSGDYSIRLGPNADRNLPAMMIVCRVPANLG